MGLGPFFFGENKNMLNRRADKLELLRIAEAVALEKSIDKELNNWILWRQWNCKSSKI